MHRWIAIALASSLISISSAATTPSLAQDSSSQSALDEVRRSFTLDGKPVSPEIFRDMGDGDLADSGSILVTVDLKAAIRSNLYYDDIKPDGPGWVGQRTIDKRP